MQSVFTNTAHAYACTNKRYIITTLYKTTHNLESTWGKFHLGPGLRAHLIKKGVKPEGKKCNKPTSFRLRYPF